MYILSLDSTAPTATAAISLAGENFEEVILKGLYTINTSNTHSQTLLPMIENLLSSLALHIDDIDMFALSAGPGSFTGVRIGAATIKGLAFGREKPCVGVSTLEALAANLTGFKGVICPVMNARRDQLYTAIFVSDGNKIIRITDDAAISTGELKVKLESIDGGSKEIYFTGDGYSIARESIVLENVKKTPELLRYQNAYSVASAAFKKYRENDISNGNKMFTDSAIIPVYLRPSQAERQKNELIMKSKEIE